MNKFWAFFTDCGYGRLLLLLAIPLWVPVVCALALLYFLTFLVWALIGPPIVFVAKGYWLDPSVDDWMRRGP